MVTRICLLKGIHLKEVNKVSEQCNERHTITEQEQKAFYFFMRICLHRHCSPKCSNLHVSLHTDEIFSRRAAHCFNCFSACVQLFTWIVALCNKRDSLFIWKWKEQRTRQRERARGTEREKESGRERDWLSVVMTAMFRKQSIWNYSTLRIQDLLLHNEEAILKTVLLNKGSTNETTNYVFKVRSYC